MGVPVIIENRPGAGCEIGTTYVYRAKADGYTILSNNMPDHAMVCVMQTPIYKFEEIIPMVLQFRDPRVLIVKKDSPLNTFIDFIEEAKKHPGKMSIGVSQASGQFMQASFLKNTLKLDIKIVPFKGGGDAAVAMLGGHIDVAWGDAFSRINLREQTKCIGVSATQPNALWSEGQPVNAQLKKYGIFIPDIPRDQYIFATAKFKKDYQERYKKLQNIILKTSQNPEYMQMEKKQQLDSIRVWEVGEKYQKDMDEQYDFIKKNKAVFKDQ